jgi:hypothetical protein
MPYQYSAMIDNGKIVRSMIYFDRMAVNTAMGYELVKNQPTTSKGSANNSILMY